MFGRMEIPGDRDLILLELECCRIRFFHRPSRYLQARIDELEYALDRYRRGEDV